ALDALDGAGDVEVHVLQGEREMARDNKSLGLFHLDGIVPAPRGIPQIEVTFDIDANGIVNVSAKDLGTGKDQHITITSSSNMSKEDVEHAVKDAEQFAAEDKKRREEIDLRNSADQMVYQSEKTLGDVGEKLSSDDKAALQSRIDALKEALKGDEIEVIKTKQKELQDKFYELSAKIYQQQPQGDPNAYQQQGPQAGGTDNNNGSTGGTGATDGYVDADYREVNDN
ncbi:MAG TPA: Hsp70 family protein, partial [Oscillospiraceae bacterium]|nr:Hsp70 family protein [Oscillospiraceae bacterium]